MSETPKPCPICGNPAPFFYDHRAGDVVTRMAGCTGCGLRIDARNWNRRTPGPATAAMVAHARLYVERGFHTVPSREVCKAFIAEHEPAKAEKAES